MSTTITELLDLPTVIVQKALKSALNTSATPLITRVKRLDEGKGYLSLIARLKLKWPRGTDNTNLPRTVVVKMPTVDKLNSSAEGIKAEEKKFGNVEDSEAEKPNFETFLLPVHNAECRFFNQIGPYLTGDVFVPIPHVYHTRSFDCTTNLQPGDYGLIIMEDLVGKGRSLQLSTEVLTVGQMGTLINSIASLQAYSILNPDWNRDGLYQPITAFNWAECATSVWGSLIAFRSEYPADFTASDEDIRRIADPNVIQSVYSLNPAEIDYFPVMVHGDLWMNNVMFSIDKNGNLSDSLLAVIDWQSVQPGPFTDDFTYLSATSVDTDVRRANTYRWLKLYYRLLGEKLPEGTKIPFTFDEIVSMYKKTFRFSTLMMAVLLPYILNDPSTADKYTKKQRGKIVKRLQKNIDDTLDSYNDQSDVDVKLYDCFQSR